MNIPLSKKVIEWAQKNKYAFILIVSLIANSYQFVNKENSDLRKDQLIKELQQNIDAVNKESLQAERDRQSKQDELLRELLRQKSNN